MSQKKKQLALDKDINLSDALELTKKEKDNVQKVADVYEKLSEKEKVSFSVVTSSFYSGPLPHPSILQSFNEIDNSFAGRIFVTFEEQHGHIIDMEDRKMKMEEKQQEIDNKHFESGEKFAKFYLLLVFGVSALLIYLGKDLSGLAVIVMHILTFLISLFKKK